MSELIWIVLAFVGWSGFMLSLGVILGRWVGTDLKRELRSVVDRIDGKRDN